MRSRSASASFRAACLAASDCGGLVARRLVHGHHGLRLDAGPAGSSSGAATGSMVVRRVSPAATGSPGLSGTRRMLPATGAATT